MDTFTFSIIVILFCLTGLIILSFINLVSRVKKQTKSALQKIGEQIKQRIAERIILAVVTRRKNFYQTIRKIIEIVFNSFKTVFSKIKSNYQKGKGNNQGAKSKKYIKIKPKSTKDRNKDNNKK
jgi:hypothetical protein